MDITNDRIELKELSENDLILMMDWRNNKENKQYFFSQETITLKNQKKWYQAYLKKDNDKMFIIKTQKNEPIGTIALYNIDTQKKHGEIGRILIGDKKFRRKGIATNAFKLLINTAFRVYKLDQIFLRVNINNTNAINLYKKNGFKIKEQSQYQSLFKVNNNALLMALK